MINLHERVADLVGSNWQPPDHQSDAHSTESPRSATQQSVAVAEAAYKCLLPYQSWVNDLTNVDTCQS